MVNGELIPEQAGFKRSTEELIYQKSTTLPRKFFEQSPKVP